MVSVTVCSDMGAQENKACQCFHFFSIIVTTMKGGKRKWDYWLPQKNHIVCKEFSANILVTLLLHYFGADTVEKHWQSWSEESWNYCLILNKWVFKWKNNLWKPFKNECIYETTILGKKIELFATCVDCCGWGAEPGLLSYLGLLSPCLASLCSVCKHLLQFQRKFTSYLASSYSNIF